MFLIRIPELLGSNLGRDTCYLGRGWFSSVPPGKYQGYSKVKSRSLPNKSPSIHRSSVTLSFFPSIRLGTGSGVKRHSPRLKPGRNWGSSLVTERQSASQCVLYS
jgi:hypothetical protein